MKHSSTSKNKVTFGKRKLGESKKRTGPKSRKVSKYRGQGR